MDTKEEEGLIIEMEIRALRALLFKVVGVLCREHPGLKEALIESTRTTIDLPPENGERARVLRTVYLDLLERLQKL